MALLSGPLVSLHNVAWRFGLDVLPVPRECRGISGMAAEDVFRLQGLLQRLLGYSRSDTGVDLPEWAGLVTAALKLAAEGQRPHGQMLQDVWVLQCTGYQRVGYFVEIGAGDGQYLSNSLMLERDFGWRGILCEPNPTFAHAIQVLGRPESRLVPLVVGPRSGELVPFVSADERSAVAGGSSARSGSLVGGKTVTSVATVSPKDVLEESGAPEVIDYMSVDTEGSEPGILRAFPFSDHHVRYLTVEHNHVRGRVAELDSILVPLGYERVMQSWSGVDAWYVHSDERSRS